MYKIERHQKSFTEVGIIDKNFGANEFDPIQKISVGINYADFLQI